LIRVTKFGLQVLVGTVLFGVLLSELGAFRPQSDPARSNSVFSSIPGGYLQSFQDRLIRLIKAQNQQDWPEVYKMLPAREKTQESSSEFAKRQIDLFDWQLIDFQLTETLSLQNEVSTPRNGFFEALGCALTKKGSQQAAYDAGTTAVLENGEWSISIITLTSMVDGNIQKCKFDKSKSMLRPK
jgi:hypothetical protein